MTIMSKGPGHKAVSGSDVRKQDVTHSSTPMWMSQKDAEEAMDLTWVPTLGKGSFRTLHPALGAQLS